MHKDYESMRERLDRKASWLKGWNRAVIGKNWRLVNMDPDPTTRRVTNRIGIEHYYTIIMAIHMDGQQDILHVPSAYEYVSDMAKINEFLQSLHMYMHYGVPILGTGRWYDPREWLPTEETVISPDGSVIGAYTFEDVWDGSLFDLVKAVYGHLRSMRRRADEGRYDLFGEKCSVCNKISPGSALEFVLAHYRARRTCDDLMPRMKSATLSSAYDPGVTAGKFGIGAYSDDVAYILHSHAMNVASDRLCRTTL